MLNCHLGKTLDHRPRGKSKLRMLLELTERRFAAFPITKDYAFPPKNDVSRVRSGEQVEYGRLTHYPIAINYNFSQCPRKRS